MKLGFGRFAGALAVALLAAGLSIPAPAEAARARPLPRDAALVIDATSGRVLYQRNADEIRYPASLTKMMTLYLLFEGLENGTLILDSQIATSRHAAGQTPTKLNLRVGETIPVRTAIEAVVILSANDVAVVIAEALGGTEDAFAAMMTQKARALGMARTSFANASGLPDSDQTTTAADMALLGRRLAYDFPQYYTYFALHDFTFKGRRYATHDNLLAAFSGTDGIKTGYTRASGFNLVTSAVRGNKHIIGIVMGGTSAAARDREMTRLLTIAFEEAEHDPLLVAFANVPWRDGIGPKTYPIWTMPAPPAAVLASFEPPRRPAAPARTVVAAVVPPAKAAVPLAKPLPGTSNDLIAALAGERAAGPVGVDGASSVPAAGIAMTLPVPKPNVRVAAAPAPVEEGDISGPSQQLPDPAKRWSVQIGAFMDQQAAAAQLAKSAERSMDVVGQAQQLVVPFTSAAGARLYRARFGLFAESEARAVCQRMMSRGDTCFATLHGG